jgi:hypothetical protein
LAIVSDPHQMAIDLWKIVQSLIELAVKGILGMIAVLVCLGVAYLVFMRRDRR